MLQKKFRIKKYLVDSKYYDKLINTFDLSLEELTVNKDLDDKLLFSIKTAPERAILIDNYISKNKLFLNFPFDKFYVSLIKSQLAGKTDTFISYKYDPVILGLGYLDVSHIFHFSDIDTRTQEINNIMLYHYMVFTMLLFWTAGNSWNTIFVLTIFTVFQLFGQLIICEDFQQKYMNNYNQIPKFNDDQMLVVDSELKWYETLCYTTIWYSGFYLRPLLQKLFDKSKVFSKSSMENCIRVGTIYNGPYGSVFERIEMYINDNNQYIFAKD